MQTLKQCLNNNLKFQLPIFSVLPPKGESVVNDLDIMVLLYRHVDKHQVYFNLTHKLSQVTNISEDLIDLLFFDLEEANLTVLTRAVNKGILLKNDDPEYLSNAIDNL